MAWLRILAFLLVAVSLVSWPAITQAKVAGFSGTQILGILVFLAILLFGFTYLPTGLDKALTMVLLFGGAIIPTILVYFVAETGVIKFRSHRASDALTSRIMAAPLSEAAQFFMNPSDYVSGSIGLDLSDANVKKIADAILAHQPQELADAAIPAALLMGMELSPRPGVSSEPWGHHEDIWARFYVQVKKRAAFDAKTAPFVRSVWAVTNHEQVILAWEGGTSRRRQGCRK